MNYQYFLQHENTFLRQKWLEENTIFLFGAFFILTKLVADFMSFCNREKQNTFGTVKALPSCKPENSLAICI